MRNPIPSTRKWTIEELKFFNLHYYQVTDPSLWSTYFCAEAPVRPEVNDTATSKFGAEDIIQGAHIGLPVHLRLFGEKLYSTLVAQRTEAATDDLVMYLLQICNPGHILLAVPRMGQFKIKVGEHEFVSQPDATVEARTKINFVGPPFVVVEDKLPYPDPLGDPNEETELDKLGVKGSNKQHYKQKWNIESKKEDTPTLAKFQLAGEMLAAAVHNCEVYQMPQTVFALQVIVTRVTHHRADFPVSYLESIKKGTPTGNITIFRMGGSDSFEDRGVGLLHYGEDRKNLIQWICNIMNACEQITISLKNNKVPHITAERIAQLEKY